VDERVALAGELYKRSIFAGDGDALAAADRQLDAVEAELLIARGRILHGRFLKNREGATDRQEVPGSQDVPGEGGREGSLRGELAFFERAFELFRELGDEGGEVEALFWIGCFHQVVRGDNDAAVPVLLRARELAVKVGDRATLSEILRHLGIAEHSAGRLDEGRALLEESTGIRRELGLQAGAAANLVGLIYIARAQGRDEDARALAAEGKALAEAAGATTILSQLTQAADAL
jgi:hypothetical protein